MASITAEVLPLVNTNVPVTPSSNFKLSTARTELISESSDVGSYNHFPRDYFDERDINENPLDLCQLTMHSNSNNYDESPSITGAAARKSIGAFTSSMINIRYNNIEAFNNNLNSFSSVDTPKMTSNSSSYSEDKSRVPVNGEIIYSSSKLGAADKSSQVGQTSTGRDLAHHKTNFASTSAIEPCLKYSDFMTGPESWKDDSLSLSSSFSSSMSSIPSIPTPPSPASPPSFRPQSLPHEDGASMPGCDLFSSSLPPESAFHTTYLTSSCGGSPRKRVKDREGFIRRAACVCVNADETEVLLVSSKNSSEVWLVPGGGLEEGEDAQEAALREAYEEAGVRGTVLAYLGLFESRSEMSASGKKHRTAVFVIKVISEEDDFPESKTLGRQRKWMSIDDALSHLTCYRPRQSVYLSLLRATRLKARTSESSDEKSSGGETALQTIADRQYRTGEPIKLLEREDSEGSVETDENLAVYEDANDVTLLVEDPEDESYVLAKTLESQTLID
ncbi:uncharacterized protein LOC108680848 [Hyalella azteca]|uniref:diphosphoinositol-polyphosphate diphosphatase n=1 Tax=Hyalella azteca TaxID=294128 RepID=A0A8B7PGI1_HYAAZ|nr:uncharacterized protein LOC108680848 [Hyalella azteca]